MAKIRTAILCAPSNFAMAGTEAGYTFSSNTGSLNVAISIKSRVKEVSGLEETEARSAEMIDSINWVIAGPTRIARVDPVMSAIFLIVVVEVAILVVAVLGLILVFLVLSALVLHE